MIQLTNDFTSLWPSSPSFEELMAIEGEIFSQGHGREVVKFSVGQQNFFIKKHFGIGWKEILKECIQGKSPVLGAKHEWQAIQYLNKLGVSTLEPVGFGLRGVNPAKQQSFIITKALTQTISLEKLTQTWQQNPPSRSEKLKLLNNVALLAKTLHENGFVHRDFYLCHILKHHEQSRLFLIDLHRAQIFKAMPKRWLIKELGSLYFSSMLIGLTRRDLLRFIQTYANKPLRTIFSEQPDLWHQIEQRAVRLMAKAIRKGIVPQQTSN